VRKLKCDVCERALGLTEAQYCRAGRGRLTYPRIAVDGVRRETECRWLCRSCLRRAGQYRREGDILPTTGRVRTSRPRVRRDPSFLLGIAAIGVFVAVAMHLLEEPGDTIDVTNPTVTTSQQGSKLPARSSGVLSRLPKSAQPERHTDGSEVRHASASSELQWIVTPQPLPSPAGDGRSVTPRVMPAFATKKPGSVLKSQAPARFESVVPEPNAALPVRNELATSTPALAPPSEVPEEPVVATNIRAHPPAASSKTQLRSVPAVLHVSTRTPRKGRAIRVALQLPESAVPSGPPVLRMQDARGTAYRSVMRPGDQPGEWVWTSGLDVIGAWQGRANVRMGNRTVTATLPAINVLP
jgi:hypothetical protein